MLKAELRRSISQQKRQFTPQQLAQLSLPVLERLRPLLISKAQQKRAAEEQQLKFDFGE
jgi:hypothetical protein